MRAVLDPQQALFARWRDFDVKLHKSSPLLLIFGDVCDLIMHNRVLIAVLRGCVMFDDGPRVWKGWRRWGR